MAPAGREFAVPESLRFTDVERCLEETRPDIALLCPATGRHGEFVERVAPYGVHILVEKPMAANLRDADAMIAAVAATGKTLVINWPLAWYPPHITTKRLIAEGAIGEAIEIHYYDGNRGPLRHLADKVEVSAEDAARQMRESWWYRKDAGGGSLLDYLGYGVTLGRLVPRRTRADRGDVRGGRGAGPGSGRAQRHDRPVRVRPEQIRNALGNVHGPLDPAAPAKCGFVVVGTAGTISSYDYEPTIRVQTSARPEAHEIPVDTIPAPRRNPIEYLIHCLETGEEVTGPLSPRLSRIGQQIVATAVASAAAKRTCRC
jgi:glucose-fructose oxidoreductase